jgi:NAD(P)-dependent dehydrogenase (short-subunit alcohol dehydrogenase family)
MAGLIDRLFSLEGRTALVIGGTGVLCGRMSETLAAAGAKVAVAGRSAEKGAERVKSIEADGGKAVALVVDSNDRGSLERLAVEAESALGPIDILINGAGVNSPTPVLDIQDDEWDRILRTNLRGVHVACQVVGKRMIERGAGSIINIGSVSAVIPLSRVFSYSASKAAVLNYTMNLAREWAPRGVRVNCLSPGFIPAEQNRRILDPARVEKIMARTPMARFGEPHDLDAATVFLASPGAGFVTGVNLIVDGGFSCMSI